MNIRMFLKKLKVRKFEMLRDFILQHKVGILTIGITSLLCGLILLLPSPSDEIPVKIPCITGIGHEIIVDDGIRTYINGKGVTIEDYQRSLELRPDGVMDYRTVSETIWSHVTVEVIPKNE